MLIPKTRWMFQQSDEQVAKNLVKELGITPLVASLLVNRGIEDPVAANRFLYDKDVNFNDPFLLLGMDVAVERIKYAISEGEPILIFGDYDADGVTSTSVMILTLKQLGANVQYYIPNRFTEGYGPNEQAFRYAAESGIRLIITVDCGIAAIHEAAVAKQLGVDLIITDHHEPGEQLPEALAIIHPKLRESPYPFRELAGVGVAFKLAHALLGEVPEHLLDLVAIGTIADLVPLLEENRLIAKKGLDRLKITKRVGIKSLFKMAGSDLSNINEETVGFVLAPRINAAGRLDSAEIALELLLTDDPFKAETIAEELESLNKERQTLVNEMVLEAMKEVEERNSIEDNSVIVVGKAGWNAGVIGIVASKLVDKYYRPTIVFSYDEEKGLAKGSARSIEGFDLFQNLSSCRDLLPHFGGHPMAAGMTLKIEDVEELRRRLNDLAKKLLSPEDFIPVTKLEQVVEVEDANLEAIQELELLAPFGMCNPKPKVLIKGAKVSQMKKIGGDQRHLKLVLEKDGAYLDGIGFGLGEAVDHISPISPVEVIGELAVNEWNNIRKPQIFVQDIAVRTWQLFDYRGARKLEQIMQTVDTAKWIIFDRDNIPLFSQKNSFVIATEEDAKNLDMEEQNIVLVDLPPSKSVLQALFHGKKPSRIYVHFFHKGNDYFSTMPTREHFKWYYAFLAKKAPFDLKRYGDELAKYRGWSRQTIDFMSQVFLELGFISESNGFITLNKVKNKKDLSESTTYQQKHALFELEGELLYSSIEELRKYFDEWIMGGSTEEAVKEWI